MRPNTTLDVGAVSGFLKGFENCQRQSKLLKALSINSGSTVGKGFKLLSSKHLYICMCFDRLTSSLICGTAYRINLFKLNY